jgi:CRISPR system Cascade subunit CasD
VTTSVLLRLEGPLQCWGTRSRFPERDTETEPSKSGVLGLVGAALGMTRDDLSLLEQIAACQMAVRVDHEGTILRDYHTAGGGTFRGEPHSVFEAKGTVLTSRHYLQDASFLVALGYSGPALASRIDHALGTPKWPLALGRRSCPPSLPVRAGVVGVAAEEAVRGAPWPSSAPPPSAVRMVMECDPREPGAQPRQDQPLSFRLHDRHYARRFVRTAYLDPSALTLTTKESPCISLVAF